MAEERLPNAIRNLSFIILIVSILAILANAIIGTKFQVHWFLFGFVGLMVGYLFLQAVFAPTTNALLLLIVAILAVTVVLALVQLDVIPKISASLLGNAGDFSKGGLAEATKQLQSFIMP